VRQINRRQWSVLALATVAATAIAIGAIVGSDLPDTRRSSCQVAAPQRPTCGAWWGAALPATDSHLVSAVAAQEASTDRRLDIVHTYHRWQDNFPTSAEAQLAAAGHLLFLNWEPRDPNGQSIRWADIAAGGQDDTIDRTMQRLADVRRPVLVSFSHEPEQDYSRHGTAEDFRAAFRHVVDRARAVGAKNVLWVWNVMGLSDPTWLSRYQRMWPGDSYVDWVAWDPYNFASCRGRPWKSFVQTVRPFYDWLTSHGLGHKPFMLAEYGTIEDPTSPDGKAHWLADIPAALAAMPKLRALVYFDLPAPPANCDWRSDTSASSSAAFHVLATNHAFAWPARQHIGQ
jgi:hypothetical protein